MPQVPQVPQAPQVPQISQVSQVPEVPQVPDVPGVPEVPQQSNWKPQHSIGYHVSRLYGTGCTTTLLGLFCALMHISDIWTYD